MIICLGRPSPDASCDRPWGDGGAGHTPPPLCGLAPGGVYRAGLVTETAGALLPHRFTLARCARAPAGGLLSVALSVGSRPLGVTQHLALWSSDFPHRSVYCGAITWETRSKTPFALHVQRFVDQLIRSRVLLARPLALLHVRALSGGGRLFLWQWLVTGLVATVYYTKLAHH